MTVYLKEESLNNMQQLTKIELTSEDAIMFVNFQKRYAFIKLLESIGSFEIKGGSITIHFDNLGCIGAVDKFEKFKI